MGYKGPKTMCQGCEKRYLGCHDHCESFIKASKDWKEFTHKAKKAKKQYMELDTYKINALAKYKR